MKIYVASLYSRIQQANQVADQLRAGGHEVTATWLTGATAEEGAAAALLDLADIDRAEALIILTFPYGTMYKGGGRNVEMGYALGRGKRVIGIGDYENIFCHHPKVTMVPTVEAALEALCT